MIVLDASAWIDVLTAGLNIRDLAEHSLYVPPHFDVEVVGSVRALRQRGSITSGQADTAIDRHLRGIFVRVYDPVDVRRAWTLRESMSLRDAWYVALAERLNATWVTVDEKAAGAAVRQGVATRTV